MKISVLAFGIAKDITGQRFLDWELGENAKLADLRAELEAKVPALLELAALRLAVNSEYANGDAVLKENDEVAIIPPVAGG